MFNSKGHKKPLAQIFKIMKKANWKYQTQLQRTPTEAGETIEEMLRRLTANKEPIPQNVPPIYTPKDEGCLPDYDIRADRFDVAYEAADKFAASERAKGANKPLEIEVKIEPQNEE